ncbi:hypothetical protein QBC36DRAFT_307038 [Triangularia setosa]|uniref:Uncharacterized protein n=1 Tax=Triangularia setosa TaxID=2587417 RepID=A0AAN7ABT2_9PEZI|nr:hypothetical protein QBC36DRAFT_307038 [Podospora setosa]
MPNKSCTIRVTLGYLTALNPIKPPCVNDKGSPPVKKDSFSWQLRLNGKFAPTLPSQLANMPHFGNWHRDLLYVAVNYGWDRHSSVRIPPSASILFSMGMTFIDNPGIGRHAVWTVDQALGSLDVGKGGANARMMMLDTDGRTKMFGQGQASGRDAGVEGAGATDAGGGSAAVQLSASDEVAAGFSGMNRRPKKRSGKGKKKFDEVRAVLKEVLGFLGKEDVVVKAMVDVNRGFGGKE